MSHSRTKAKKDFLDKLKTALENEESILNALPDDERLVEKEQKEQKRNTISMEFTATPLESFVHNVNEKHRHRTNVEKLEELIAREKALLLEQAALEQAALEQKRPEPPKPSLTIRYSRGVITPTQPIITPDEYHWEMQSNVSCHRTSWSQIGETGDNYIRPSLSSGEVRLSYKDGDLVSNKIKLDSVIKRQAASAKRRQYRFERDDPAFIQRCRGVAGRIQRMLKPGRLISDANFATRVFQDRVIQLPQHLESDADNGDATYGTLGLKSMTLYIMELCESGTTDDDDYVHMIEFVEPTIYLNPRGLHKELKDIYEGKRVSLRLTTNDATLENARSDKAARSAAADRAKLEAEDSQRRQEVARLAQEKVEKERRELRLADEKASKEADEAKLAREEAVKAATAAKLVKEKAAKAATAAKLAKEKATREAEEADRVQEVEKTKKARLAQEAARTAEEIANKEADKARLAQEAARIAEEVADKEVEEAKLAQEQVEKEREELRRAQEEAYTREELRLAQKEASESAQEAMNVEIQNPRFQLPENIKGFIKTYETKIIGSKTVNPGWWFKADGKYYHRSDTGKTTAKKTLKKANDAGWYEHATLAANSLTEDQLAFVKHVFETYDINGDDKISEVEMVRAYLEGKTKVKSSGGAKIISQNDEDGDGAINEREFINWCVISGVFDDQAWKKADKAWKEAADGATTQQEQFTSIKVDKDLPYMIGDVTQIRSVVDSSVNKAAWEKGNVVKELTSAIDKDFVRPAELWSISAKADKWLSGSDIVTMSENADVRIFYVPKDPTIDEFAVTPRGRDKNGDRLKQYINAKAICTIYVEKTKFFRNDGKEANGNVFVLKDIATFERGAKFLLSSALETMLIDNDIKSIVTQPFKDENLGTRVEKFKSWGFREIKTVVPPGLLMLSEDAAKPGDLSAMIQNMSDNWVSSDEELDFAEQSENESLEFAASSSLDTDSDMDFAQSSERGELNSEGSSLDKVRHLPAWSLRNRPPQRQIPTWSLQNHRRRENLDFAESSAVESD